MRYAFRRFAPVRRLRPLRGALLSVAVLLCGAACGSDEPGEAVAFAELLQGHSIETLLGDPVDPGPELFTDGPPINLLLAADFSRLNDDRSQDSERRPARILVRGASGAAVEVPLEVNTRGRFRLQRNICPDPPLRLRFEDSVRLGTVFDGQGRIKLVTHCRDNETYQQNLIEEYLAYRFYNLLTEFSFGVRLVRITYLDTGGEFEPKTRMGFVIEDEDVLAARLGGRIVERESTLPNELELGQLSLMYLFHFMIGNVDWGTTAGHNVKLVQAGDELLPVPYDFDWSGFVNAPYAVPNRLTEPHHETVRERLYWGVCMPGIDYPDLYERGAAVREDVLRLVREAPTLSPANVASAEEYMERFFAVIGDPVQADQLIAQACRPWL